MQPGGTAETRRTQSTIVSANGWQPGKPDHQDQAVFDNGVRIDLRGVPCPLNYARAKVALDALDKGNKLVMLLDDGDPVQRVMQSLKGEGHVIEESMRTDEGRRRVAVRCGGP